jgi:hypothetical protein
MGLDKPRQGKTTGPNKKRQEKTTGPNKTGHDTQQSKTRHTGETNQKHTRHKKKRTKKKDPTRVVEKEYFIVWSQFPPSSRFTFLFSFVSQPNFPSAQDLPYFVCDWLYFVLFLFLYKCFVVFHYFFVVFTRFLLRKKMREALQSLSWR